MMKKGDIAIQYVFLIFIGVIAVFVTVGMLANWSLGANKFMDVLTGGKPSSAQDKETIRATSVNAFKTEIVKHAKLCFESRREDAGQAGELCYTVKCCTVPADPNCAATCTASCSDIKADIERSLGTGMVSCDEFTVSSKAIIGYDFAKNIVVVR
jgi:hypothetical protein